MKRIIPGLMFILLLGVAAPCLAASSAAAVMGVVRDAHGTPQMGALVQLLGSDSSAIASAFTDDHGRYLLPDVAPGRYQMRASAAFLISATRTNLRLQAGAEAIVNLTMTSLFEAESWLPAQKRRADEPADDWKWTLRSTANRPLLRLVGPDDNSVSFSSSNLEEHRPSSQARVAVTSGDGDFGQGGIHQVLLINRTLEDGDSAIFRADIGDPQAPFPLGPSVETSAGYERRSMMAGNTRLVTSYQMHPELTYGAGAGLQVMRLASTHEMSLGDAVMIDAGTLLTAERLAGTRITPEPFARVLARVSPDLTVQYRYATGRSLQSSEDLDRVKPPVEILADISGRPLSGKGSHHEISVGRKLGDRTISMAIYHDEFSSAALVGSGMLDRGSLETVAMVTDPTTGTFRLASAAYTGRGVSASVMQPLTHSLEAWAEYDLGTALRSELGTPAPISSVAGGVAAHTAQAAGVTVRGKILRTGTSLKAEYRWQPSRTLTQVNAYNASPEEAYLGFFLRQRLWCGRFLPQGIDAVVEATNLLEQGYEPIIGPDGHTLFLAQVPRAVQGGLAFNF